MDGSYFLTAPATSNLRGFALKLDPLGRFNWATALDDLGGPGSNTQSYFDHVDADDAGFVRILGGAVGSLDFDPSSGVLAPAGTPTSGFWSYIGSLRQKAAPVASIVGLPTGIVTEGTTLALAANVIDADSNFFTYAWSITRDGLDFASGSGPAYSTYLTDQGIYTVTLTVTDETGLADSVSTTVVAVNAAPVLHATTFGTGQSLTPAIATGDQYGTFIATGNGRALIGARSAAQATWAPPTCTTRPGRSFTPSPGRQRARYSASPSRSSANMPWSARPTPQPAERCTSTI